MLYHGSLPISTFPPELFLLPRSTDIFIEIKLTSTNRGHSQAKWRMCSRLWRDGILAAPPFSRKPPPASTGNSYTVTHSRLGSAKAHDLLLLAMPLTHSYRESSASIRRFTLLIFCRTVRTSIQGASQAIEDGITLAAVLQQAGKDKIPLAVRAWEKIRYQRVRRAQITGETTRDMWHKASENAKDEAVHLPRPEWLLGFDAEKHAYDVYEQTAKEILEKGYELPTLPTD